MAKPNRFEPATGALDDELEIGFALARGLLDAKLEAAIGALLCSTTATRCAAARNAIALQFQKSKRFRNATSTALASADKAPP
jgi:hypothetical protein